MTKENENIELQKPAEETNQQKGNDSESAGTKSNPLRSFLDGTLLTKEVLLKQFPFVVFIAVLAVLYIANRYSAEKIVRKTQDIQNELKELRAEQISITSELMQISQQSEVIKLVEKNQLGLTESIEPPRTIIVKEEN
jgi:hypothetical protein